MALNASPKRQHEADEIEASNHRNSKRQHQGSNEESTFTRAIERHEYDDNETGGDCALKKQQVEHLPRTRRLLSLGQLKRSYNLRQLIDASMARWWRNSRPIISHNSQTYHVWHKRKAFER